MIYSIIFWAILFSNVPYVLLLFQLMSEKKELTIKNVLFPWPKNKIAQLVAVFFYVLIFLFSFYLREGMTYSFKDQLAIYVSFPMVFITPVWVIRRFVKKITNGFLLFQPSLLNFLNILWGI